MATEPPNPNIAPAPVATPAAQAPQGTLPAPPKAPTYTAGLTSSTGYNPTPYKVEPQGLVQHQLKNVIDSDSPLMRQAERIATQRSNERGLINTSMNIGAGQEAVIAAASPIAQADAATYDRAMTNTANQQNAASQFDAAAKNTASLSNQAAINDASKSNQSAEVQLMNTRMTQETQMALANLDSRTKVALTQMDNDTRRLLQGNQSASNAYVQTVQNIASIQQDQKLGAAAKQTAIDNQIKLLQQQLSAISSQNASNIAAVQDLDLGTFFELEDAAPAKTSTTPAGTTPKATPAQTSTSGTLKRKSSTPIYTDMGNRG